MSPKTHTSSPDDDAELTAIEAVAADWMIRRDRGLSAAEERELARWLAADRRRAAVFEALAATWELMAEAEPESSAATATRATGLKTRGFARARWWLPVGLAAAATLAVAFIGWWRMAGAGGSDGAVSFALSAATEVGVLRTVALPDGSVVQLNTDSAVEVRFEAAERRVRLVRGEAHFTVARGPQRPFIVSAAGVDVRVVGTVFNVRLRSESVDVLVTEGKVRVGSAVEAATAGEAANSSLAPAPLSELTAGQKVSIALSARAEPVATAAVVVPPAEIKQALAWQARRLDFDAAPLADIVAEINRYNRHKLVIADARLTTQRFGGSFPAGDYETFVRMLEADFGVVAERGDEETRLRLKGR